MHQGWAYGMICGGVCCVQDPKFHLLCSGSEPHSLFQSSLGMWWKGVLSSPWQARQVRGSIEGLPTHTPVIGTKPLSHLPQHPENRLISAQIVLLVSSTARHISAPARPPWWAPPLPAFCDLLWHFTSTRTHCQHKTELQLSTLSRSHASPGNGRMVSEFGPGQLRIQGENPD